MAAKKTQKVLSSREDKAAFKKINEVEEFLWDLIKNFPRDEVRQVPGYGPLKYGALGIPYDSMCYGEALIRWEKRGKDPREMFSTDDPYVLFFRKELMAKFGLEILTNAEAEERKKLHSYYRTLKVTGFPSQTKLVN